MQATICKTLDEFEQAPAGAVFYVDDDALMKCPGCGQESCCPERQGDNHPSWTMDKATHTWQPSVHHKAGCGWHGHLVNGQWVPV